MIVAPAPTDSRRPQCQDAMPRSLKSRPGFDLAIDGTPVRVDLVPRANARRYVLRVDPAARAVRMTVPPQGTLREARVFAERQANWIRTRLDRLPEKIVFGDGAIIPFKGQPHMIEHLPGARGTVWIGQGDPAPLLEEDGLPRIIVAGRLLHLPRRLRDWLTKQARAEMTRRSRRYARLLGVSFSRVSIRDQKSRWGACSASGTITFSWRLVMAPPFVMDYLAAHEVVHIREMNHSARFWKLLREVCPDTDRAEAWLNGEGRNLHRYG